MNYYDKLSKSQRISDNDKYYWGYQYNLANSFIGIISRDKNAKILRKDGNLNVKFKKVYNYSVSGNKSETLDNWDAISLTMDLKININCLKNLQLCQL